MAENKMADPIQRHHYGSQLEAAAEAFLVGAFENHDGSGLGERELPSVLVGAAMAILNRAEWEQPSAEAIKAAMHRSQLPKPKAPPKGKPFDGRVEPRDG